MGWLEEAKVDIADNELPNQPSTYVLIRRTTVYRLLAIAEETETSISLPGESVDDFTEYFFCPLCRVRFTLVTKGGSVNAHLDTCPYSDEWRKE